MDKRELYIPESVRIYETLFVVCVRTVEHNLRMEFVIFYISQQ